MSDTSTRLGGAPGCRIECRNRRAAVRHASTMEASYHPIAVPAFGPSCPARIWDLSLNGIALIVPHCYEAGAVLSVVPEVLPMGLSPALEARVLRVTPHGDGLWMAGCELLNPLTEDELHALLY
jgi:hypothetical protein